MSEVGNGNGSRGNALVIGAGVVGVCTALQLMRDGWNTTLVDRGAVGAGCSYGNAGILANDVVPPMASPGILWKVPKYVFDPEGPLAIRWRYLPELAPWLFHFIRASRRTTFERNTRTLASLLNLSQGSYEPLLSEAEAERLIAQSGVVQVFETTSALDQARQDAEFRRSLGAIVHELSPSDVRELVPELAPIFVGGLHRPNLSFVRDPSQLISVLHKKFEQAGGLSTMFDVKALRRRTDGRWSATGSAEGGEDFNAELTADIVVVACGAWSARLLRTLGLNVPLDTERGYHVSLPHVPNAIRMPVSSAEGGFYLTPMLDGLRLAGTVEFAGVDSPAEALRCDVILRRARRFLPGLNELQPRTWMGLRPSMPDSLPVIGPVHGMPKLYLAFGHGHLGLTLAAVTGKLITQVAGGGVAEIDLTAFRPDRFDRRVKVH